jgi:hypothetical protein
MSVINITGTSGAGKSHLIRSFLDIVRKRGSIHPCYLSGRTLPIGYDIALTENDRIHLIGAYSDVTTAGCDTIRDVATVFDIIRTYHQKKFDVIYEGLFVMNHTRGPQLAEELGEDMVVLQLTTPYTECVSSINKRREERGEDKLFDKKHTHGNWVRAENYCMKMKAMGARVIPVSREKALAKLMELLR